MKKLFTLLLSLIPFLGFSQYIQIPTHYDSENTSHHIIHGHIKQYLSDSVTFTTEKSAGRYITKTNLTHNKIKEQLDKVFSKGKVEYVSRTNGGYTFTIAVVDFNNDVKVINYCTFHVDAWTQKIEEIEILKGE